MVFQAELRVELANDLVNETLSDDINRDFIAVIEEVIGDIQNSDKDLTD